MIKGLLAYHKLLALLLWVVFFWQFVFQFAYTVYWKVNQTALAELYCENKDKPIMHCNGNCYLKKQLEKAENKKKEFPDVLKKLNFDFTVVCDTRNIEPITDQQILLSENRKQVFAYRKTCNELNNINSIFHPPKSDFQIGNC